VKLHLTELRVFVGSMPTNQPGVYGDRQYSLWLPAFNVSWFAK
jgi:hypothetical protein